MYGDYRDGRQFQGSKKKARKAAFVARVQKKQAKVAKEAAINTAIEQGDVETACSLLNLKVRE